MTSLTDGPYRIRRYRREEKQAGVQYWNAFSRTWYWWADRHHATLFPKRKHLPTSFPADGVIVKVRRYKVRKLPAVWTSDQDDGSFNAEAYESEAEARYVAALTIYQTRKENRNLDDAERDEIKNCFYAGDYARVLEILEQANENAIDHIFAVWVGEVKVRTRIR